MKNLKFVNLFILLIILITSSCGFLKKAKNNDSATEAFKMISLNETFSDEIYANDNVRYIFTAENTVMHSVSLTDLTADLDMALYEYFPSLPFLDQPLIKNLSTNGNYDEIIYADLTAGKQYIIFITNNDELGNTGSYNITIKSPDNPPAIDVLSLNTIHAKEFAPSNGWDMFTFIAENGSGPPYGHSISLTYNTVDPEFDLDLELYEYVAGDLIENQIHITTSDNSLQQNELIYANLIPGKKYLIRITEDSEITGSYNLKITNPDTQNIPELAKNLTATKSIVPFERKYYLFTAGNGNHTISLTNMLTDVDLRLFNYDPAKAIYEIMNDWSVTLIAESKNNGLVPDQVAVSSLIIGNKYLIEISESGFAEGTFDILISNP